jgi:DNA mismatch repair protein MutL
LRDLREARAEISEASRPLSEALREGPPGGYSGFGGEPLPERGALPNLAELRVIGQFAVGYVLVEEPGSLWIVDQHVAHERAILDRLTDPEDGGSLPTTQALLVPEVVELSPAEAADLEDHLEELSVYGFEAEPFGRDCVRVTSVVSTLANRDVAGAFREALGAARGSGPGRKREEHILATIACHSAVKLGDRLTQPEMEALIRDWLTSRMPATCPHGRSICYRIGANEVARKLDRH